MQGGDRVISGAWLIEQGPCKLEGGRNLGQARAGVHGLSRRNEPAVGPCGRMPAGAWAAVDRPV